MASRYPKRSGGWGLAGRVSRQNLHVKSGKMRFVKKLRVRCPPRERGFGLLGDFLPAFVKLSAPILLFYFFYFFFPVGDAEARLPPAGFLKFYFMRTVGYDSPSAVKVNVIVALRLCSFL